MLNLSGYTIKEKIKDRRKSIVFRATRDSDGKHVIVKWVMEGQGFWSREVLKNELQISELVAHERVIKAYCLEQNQEGYALIMEDIGGRSLHDILSEGKPDLRTFLKAALQMCESLAWIHAKNVIHKDINPGNFICDDSSPDWKVKITDFGIASLLSREEQSIVSLDKLEGTLAYISPEQTGRMNRSIDYRTDIYSLGGAFYEMLTGQTSFQATDAVGWVHHHIAVQPEALTKKDVNIPEVLSRIVLKMLAKNAEERYQSALGIKADLEECLRQLDAAGRVDDFKIGTRDVSNRFQIPQKLYGRETEISKLLQAFKIAAGEGTSEMLLVGGYSGVGKSSLVQEIHRPIVEERGYFISGKFDQFQRNVPYSAVIHAMKSLVRQLITEDEERLVAWKQRLLEALGVNGQVIIETIPETEIIMGKQPPVQELGPAETQIRFNNTFLTFINVFADREHPLVVFLDDLQWADAASLNLVKVMMSDPDTKHLLLICAYRDNEVDSHHPFITAVEEIKKGPVLIEELILEPLKLLNVNELIGDTLQRSAEDVAPLAGLVMEKTDGNPFFVNMFLKSLYQEGLIFFDLDGQSWDWNFAGIESKAGTENVLELMLNKVKQLSPGTRKAIRLGAAISNVFDLGTLSLICEEELIDTAKNLLEAVEQGYLTPLGDAQKFMVGLKDVGNVKYSEEPGERLKRASFRFVHDRIQNAAYFLIEEGERPGVHLKIGRLLLANSNSEEYEERLFDIVEQLNKGSLLIEEQAEKIALIRLNLDCGKRAKSAAAYGAAITHLEVGKDLLGVSAWAENYELSYLVNGNLAECQYLNGRYKESERLLNETLEQAKTVLDKCGIYVIRLSQYNLEAKYAEAIRIGVEALKLLKIEFPPVDDGEAVAANFQKEVEAYQNTMIGREIGELYNLPEVKDPEKIMAMDVIASLLDSALLANPGFLGLLYYKGLNFVIKNGLTDSSTLILVGTSFTAAAFLGDYFFAYHMGQLAMELIKNRFEAPKFKCKIPFLFAIASNHWGNPLKESLPYFDEAIQAGNLNGDLVYMGYAYTVKARHELACGVNLNDVLESGEKCLKYSIKVKQPAIELLQRMTDHVVKNLKGETKSKTDFSSDSFDEAKTFELFASWNFLLGTAVFNYYKLQNAYLYGEYEKALEFAARSEQTLPYIGGLIHVEQHNFYHALTLLALYEDADVETRNIYMARLEEILVQMSKWSEECPENFRHHLLMLEAEQAAAEGRDSQAAELYEQSQKVAQASGFIHDEALILERAGLFHMKKERTIYAKACLTESYNLFTRWGARGKTQAMLETYSNMIYGGMARGRRRISESTVSMDNTVVSGTNPSDTLLSSGLSSTLGGTSTMGGGIDLHTVLKVSHSVAGEMKLAKLLDKLMGAVIENAGAQTGILLLEQKGELVVATEREQTSPENKSHNNTPLSEFIKGEESKLAASIVRYAARTSETVLLNNAVEDERYGKDPHILKTRPRSILCSPILNQGKLTGLLYLENNASVGAFTPGRVEVLNVISSQAAISMENASLYSNLEEKVEERTEELRASKREIDDIFSNVKQGLLSVNPDGNIGPEYSRKVVDIFERNDLGGMKFENLFLMDRELQTQIKNYIEELLTNLFMSRELFERANPLREYHYQMVSRDKKEVIKVLGFGFSRIFKTDAQGRETKEIQKIMVVIDDKTAEYALQKDLEQKAEKQAGKVEKLYQILQLEPGIFSNFISESSATLDEVSAKLGELGGLPDANREILRVIYREVHTLKGNARALNLESIGKTAHELEDVFEELKEKPEGITEELKSKTNQAIRILKNEIQDGNSLFEKILNIQKSLQTGPKEPMEEFAERFRKIVESESSQSGKAVNFEFTNELKEPLEVELLMSLKNPLSHMVRNAVSHGIEEVLRRKELQKPERGTVKLSLRRQGGVLTLICEDDGGGLDAAQIRKKAERMKLYSAAELAKMSDKEVYPLIFSSGLSTRDEVSDSAGRGVGMDAVRAELKALSGVIAIGTKPNEYTKFTIQLPEK